jgi:hypothetical protein
LDVCKISSRVLGRHATRGTQSQPGVEIDERARNTR